MGLEMSAGKSSYSTGEKQSDGPRICIAGAGMGGLTCALALARRGFKNIEVYEMASNLGFVGAGIQLAPNMIRVLDRLGVWPDIEKEAVILHDTIIRQGSTNEELAHVKLDYIHEKYGYYHQVGHRHSLANGIYQGCLKEAAVKFNFATTISDVKSFTGRPTFTATPRNGTPYTVECDVLLGCDGIKSQIRDTMLRELNITDAKVVDTNQSAYRIILKREDMAKDPEMLELINGDRVTRWIGARRHIIAYPVSNKQIYNLSSAQPDNHFAAAPSATYTTKADKSSMLETYADFCPLVQRMLNLVPEGEVCEWKLRVHSPLPTWVHGSTALVGDACHPTLPHLAQGAAQAIEDASVIGVVLSKLTEFTPQNINKAFKVYEKVRKDRAEALVNMAAASGRELHLGEGEAKATRDAAFAALKAGREAKVPDKWADADVQKIIYGVDCEKIANEQWEELFASV